VSKATYTFVTLALLVLAGAASAAPVSVRLDAHNQRSSSGVLSTLKWATCSPVAPTNPCYSTTNAWTLANATGSTAVWTWDAATGVLSMTGTFQSTSFVSSNANGSPVISDKVVDLVIDTTSLIDLTGNTTTAASYRCVEGTFLSSVGANGCLNVSTGDDFTNDSSALYDVGGNAKCVQRTVGGDDLSTGNTRGVTSVVAAPPCDAQDGAFDLWNVQVDNTAVQGSDRKLVIRNAIPITLPSVTTPVLAEAGANFLTFTALPTAADDAVTGFQDTPVNIDVLANDSAFDDPVTVTTATNPTNGTALVNGSPGNQAGINVTYTPNAGFAGTDTFTYTVSSGPATDTATVTVTVVAFGANDDTATTRWNTPVTVNVLANDVGFTSTGNVTVTKTDGTNGTVVVNGSPGTTANVNVTYTPAANFVGTDTFTYTVSDGIVPDDTATVTVAVTNEVPTAGPGTITSISTAGFDPSTRTGTFNAAGNNLGDAPSVVTADGATKGTVSVGTGIASTTVTYTPSATFFEGTDTFTYTITDSDDETATNTVTVTIADASPAVSDDTSTTGNANTTLNGSAAFTAGNGSVAQHTLSVLAPAANGSCVASVSGSNIAVAYTPNADYAGGDSCVVRLVDADGDADDGTFSFTVRAAPGGGGGAGGLLPGGSGAFDPWSLAFLAGLPLLGRLRSSRRRLTAGNR
jgi:hypothetical protein